MNDPMNIMTSSMDKPMDEMTEKELQIVVSDLREVVEYLTRPDASYDEQCYAQSVRETVNLYETELDKRLSTE